MRGINTPPRAAPTLHVFTLDGGHFLEQAFQFDVTLPIDIHRLIRERRKRLGLTEQQFAQAVGVSRAAVQQWERPGGTAPKRTNQLRVAAVLGISLYELVSGRPRAHRRRTKAVEVPVVTEPAAVDRRWYDDPMRPAAGETVMTTVPVGPRTHAMRVGGESVLDGSAVWFPVGSILIIEPELAAAPDDYVVVRTATGKLAVTRWTGEREEGPRDPSNPHRPPTPRGDGVVIGVVREMFKRFR